MGNVINGIKLPSVKGRAGEKGSALDLANGDLSKLKPEQIKNVYNELKQHRDKPRGDKYGDAYYKISAYSTELLNEIKAKGAGAITDDNAGKVAAWLEVNKNIQQEVNKNRAKENEDRNAEIEGFLKNRKPKEKDEKKQENKQERTEQKHTGLAAEYEDFANSMGKKVDAAFLRDCGKESIKMILNSLLLRSVKNTVLKNSRNLPQIPRCRSLGRPKREQLRLLPNLKICMRA